jgi:hypothetical protein
LTFQLRDVDVDAALLGDRLDRSREIGVTQQVLVAHPADGRLRGLRQIEDERDCVQRAQQTQRTFLGEKPLELLLQPSLRWKGINMRKTLLALAAAATLAVSAASPAYAGPPTYPGPGGYPYWSGYVDAPVGEPTPPATGVPSASGTVLPGACAACAFAADQVAAVSVPRPADSAM